MLTPLQEWLSIPRLACLWLVSLWHSINHVSYSVWHSIKRVSFSVTVYESGRDKVSTVPGINFQFFSLMREGLWLSRICHAPLITGTLVLFCLWQYGVRIGDYISDLFHCFFIIHTLELKTRILLPFAQYTPLNWINTWKCVELWTTSIPTAKRWILFFCLCSLRGCLPFSREPLGTFWSNLV